MELESTEGSTSSVAVVGTGEAIMSLDNPIVYNRYYLMISTNFNRGCCCEICVCCYHYLCVCCRCDSKASILPYISDQHIE